MRSALGAPLAIGTITPNAIAPYAEALDESCAAVIQHFLRWTPDAITAFDYTTTPYPTLSIVQRSSAASVTLPAYGAPVSGLELTPRHDLQTPCVQLKFEQTNDIDGDTFTVADRADRADDGDRLRAGRAGDDGRPGGRAGDVSFAGDHDGADSVERRDDERGAVVAGKISVAERFRRDRLDGGGGDADRDDREPGELSRRRRWPTCRTNCCRARSRRG